MNKQHLSIFAMIILTALVACAIPSSTEMVATKPIEEETTQESISTSTQPATSEITEPPSPTSSPTPSATRSPLGLFIEAFAYNSAIPTTYTCSGQDISPQLNWTEPPAGTQSFTIILDDPDAPGGVWVHWVMFNIPASEHGLSQAIPKTAQLADGSLQGLNSWGTIGYRGPCPPPGGTHRYIFRLYALDSVLELASGATRSQLWQAMQGHILEQAEWSGTFGQ